MRILLLLLLGQFLASKAISQQAKFVCPIKKGKIVNYKYSSEVSKKPGVTFKSKNLDVRNILNGRVISIDTVSGQVNVYIEAGDYFFSYHGFQNVGVTKGQVMKAGETIGRLKKGERLFLIMSYKKELVEPKEYLDCKIVTGYL